MKVECYEAGEPEKEKIISHCLGAFVEVAIMLAASFSARPFTLFDVADFPGVTPRVRHRGVN